MPDLTTAETAAAYAAAKAAGDAYLAAFDAAFAPVVAVAGGLPDPAASERRTIAMRLANITQKAAALAAATATPTTAA